MGEHFAFPDVLICNGGGEVLPARIFRIGRRLAGVKGDVTRTARDTHLIGAHERSADRIILIVVIAPGIPLGDSVALEIRVIEEPEAHYPSGTAINLWINGSGLSLPVLRFVNPETILVGLRRGTIPGLIDEAQGLDSIR